MKEISVFDFVVCTICSIIFYLSVHLFKFLWKRRKTLFLKGRCQAMDYNNIIKFCIEDGGSNVFTRHQCKSCYELDMFDRNTPLTKDRITFTSHQYIKCCFCEKKIAHCHPVYPFCCRDCGNKLQLNRTLSLNLINQISLVIGCRTKLGHQVVLKLLRAGSKVIGTTRSPQTVKSIFEKYDDSKNWLHNLCIYSKPIDLDNKDLVSVFAPLESYIERNYGVLTNIVFCAAHNITEIELAGEEPDNDSNKEKENTNSSQWSTDIYNIVQNEMEKNSRIDAVAPAILLQTMIPLMRKSLTPPYFITVHGREGVFGINKTEKHIDVNMEKVALHMLTRCIPEEKLKTNYGQPFSIHGCDPGYYSMNDCHEDGVTYSVSPIDEIDGASLILYPLFKKLISSTRTRTLFNVFVA